MSMPSPPSNAVKIFGIRIGVDPKILIGGLIALTLFFVWYNLRDSDDERSSSALAPAARATLPTANRPPVRRNANQRQSDRAGLAVKPVDAARGDIDPTLHLSLLERLRAVPFHPGGRNLFDNGALAAATNLPPAPKGPTMLPKALPSTALAAAAAPPAAPQVNIPLKYYGFVKPGTQGEDNRGFFMDGDVVLVGVEGQTLQSRYLIVTLSPNMARLEDTQMKQGQDLQVAPEAVAQ
jgi:hypothetical protein